MLSHPSNFRHPYRWHVRTYGLFTANPFGDRPFPEGEPRQGAYTVAKGDSLTLRYRVPFHKGTTDAAKIGEAYSRFVR